MASRFVYLTILFALVASAVLAADESPAGAADELHLSNDNTNVNPSTNDLNPSLDNNNPNLPRPGPNNQIPRPQNDLMRPDDEEEDERGDFLRPFFFGPPPSPRGGPLSFLFDSLRRGQQVFDRQFQQLERQAGEGQEVSYFSRNGVSYVKTCTTKRVDQQQGQQQGLQQGLQQQESQQESQLKQQVTPQI